MRSLAHLIVLAALFKTRVHARRRDAYAVGAGAYNPRLWRPDAELRAYATIRSSGTDAPRPAEGSQGALLGERNRPDHLEDLWCVRY